MSQDDGRCAPCQGGSLVAIFVTFVTNLLMHNLLSATTKEIITKSNEF